MTSSRGADGIDGPRKALAARLRGVRKRFGYRDVLRAVDLDVERGTCLAVAGPNGAGKSTLLRIISTQWTVTAGEVEVLGIDARAEPLAVRRRVGVCAHESFLRRELSLEENLRFAGDLFALGGKALEMRIDVLCETFGLAHRRRDRVAIFSQGMLRRASLARSLLHEPDLWILDEPFSGLDAGGRDILRGSIGEFHGAGGTVILVTHEAALSEALANSTLRVEGGLLVPAGAGNGIPAGEGREGP
jgi:ABC-type multidrug transport system ATPase subunit